MKMMFAEKSLIEEEAASIIPRSRASWHSFASLAGKTCKSEKFLGWPLFFSLLSFFSDKRKSKRKETTGALYIDHQEW